MPSGLKDIHEAGFRLEEVPGAGRCLVACRSFDAGAVLMLEKPVVQPSAREMARHIAKVPYQFSLLRGTANLKEPPSQDEAMEPFMLEVMTNAYVFDGRIILFNAFSMINHACAMSLEENVCFNLLSAGDMPLDDMVEVRLVAVRGIVAGEALRTSYHRVFTEPAKVSKQIKVHCGGSCGCSLCELRSSPRDLQQISHVVPGAVECQHCGQGGSAPCEGDLVAIRASAESAYEYAHARVVRCRKEDRVCLVMFMRHGIEEQSWIANRDVLVLNPAGQGLLRCGRCKAVAYCSAECQRNDWMVHKALCSGAQASAWEDDYREFLQLRSRASGTAKCQAASPQELRVVVRAGLGFIKKWTQLGRNPHLVFGHYAIQDTVLSVITLGTLMLWQQCADGAFDSEGWVHLAGLAQQHFRLVRSIVPRFHCATWTALHHIRGLLSLRHLLPQGEGPAKKAVEDLAAITMQQADVMRAFEFSATSDFQMLSEQGTDVFRRITGDPSKFEAFCKVDPNLSPKKKLEQMSRMLWDMETSPLPPVAPAFVAAEQPAGHSTDAKRRQSALELGARVPMASPEIVAGTAAFFSIAASLGVAQQ